MFEDLNEVVKKFGEKKVRQALEMWREYYEARADRERVEEHLERIKEHEEALRRRTEIRVLK